MQLINAIRRRLFGAPLLMVFALIALSVSACTSNDGGGADTDTPSNGEESAAGDEAGAGGGDAAGDDVGGGEEGDDDSPPEGMISSGTAERPPTIAPPERIQQAGVSRNVTASEARAAVPFTLYEPSELPDDTHRDVVRLNEPIDGQDSEGLPQVFFVYTIGSVSGFVLRQSPAGTTSVEGEGESVDVAGQTGTLIDDRGRLALSWEIGDTAFYVSSNNVERDLLLSIASSVQPIE